MLTITATGRYSKCVSNEVITAGSVGIPAVFNLNEDFDGLSPIAVFRGSGVSFDVALIGSEVIVPHEVLANVGGILEVGVYARNGEGTIVIPTVWSVAGTIREGAIASGVDPSEPTPDWTAQVQAAASEAVQTANDAKDIAEDAKEVAITSADSAQKSAANANDSAARSSAAASAAERARDSAEQYRGDTLTYSVMADEAANNARTYAQNAEASARATANSADVATQKEAAASEAATNAARSEENAFNSAREATDASDNAEQAAEQASLSAGRADESSQNAVESARLAALSEAVASTSALTANEAKIASETAQSEAEAAKVAAETAKNRSEELYDYVTEANRSATEAAALAVAAKTDAETAAESATESAAIVQEVADRLPAIEEDLDIAKTTANDARITLFDATQLVDYAVRDLNYTGTPGTADSTCLGVKRRGSRIVLNGGNISNASRPISVVKLTGNTTGRTNNFSTVRTWSDGITLKNERTYRVTVIYISGETTSENAPPAVTVSVYNLGESSTIGYGKRNENNRYIRYFKATGELNLALYVPCYQVTYTDYTVDVILEEVEETVGEYLPSMVANGALAVNDFVIVDNELFRITAPVASGGTLIIGTNCEKVTITKTLSRQIDETNELKDGINDTQAMIATVEADSTASKEYAIGDLLVFESKLYRVVSAISLGDTLIPEGNIELTTVEQQLASSGGGAVNDIQINGTSILDAQGVASIPIASSSRLGAVKVNPDRGIFLIWGDTLQIAAASSPNVKTGTNAFQPIVPMQQHESAFYGLAKAAGHDEKDSTLPVGQYTDAAKAAIQSMLNVPDKSDVDSKSPSIYKTVGPAAIASFVDGADDMPLKSLSVAIEPVQDLHGYDNPWPAGGGDNKLPPYSSETQNDVMLTADSEGNITLNGTASAVCRFNLVFDTAIPSGRYYISFFNTAMSGVEFILLNSGGTAISDIVLSSANYRSVLNASADIASVRIYIASGTQLTNAKLSPMLASGNTAPTAFKPYSNLCPISGWDAVSIWNKPTHDTSADPTVTIQLGQTVYGDTLDVAAGTLMVDRWYLTKANASRIKYYFTATPPRVEMLFESDKLANANTQTNAFSSMYQSTTGVQNKRMKLYGTEIDIYDTNFTDQAATDAILADFVAVYKLRTPFTIDLDPAQITTLYGANNIWSDAGMVTVEYPVDTKSYVDAQTAALSGQIDTLTDDVDALEAAQPRTITITGTTPVIAAADNTRYVCGEVSTLDITPPVSGVFDVIFTSGSTPTVLTATGVAWPEWFDSTTLEADTVYEINVSNGYGVIATWPV